MRRPGRAGTSFPTTPPWQHAAYESGERDTGERTTMKAFLLAAGEGTRLRPITNSIPKCLVPIRRQPLLGIWLELCRESGIDEVLINLHSHGDSVRQFLAEDDCGVRVTLSEEPVLLGSAGTIAANRAWVESDAHFFVFYADV